MLRLDFVFKSSTSVRDDAPVGGSLHGPPCPTSRPQHPCKLSSASHFTHPNHYSYDRAAHTIESRYKSKYRKFIDEHIYAASMPGKIITVTSASHFETLLTSSTYTIVDFYADWCGPCKAIAPVFQTLAEKETKPGKLQFVKVDVDAQQEVAKKYGVSAYVLQIGGCERSFRDSG